MNVIGVCSIALSLLTLQHTLAEDPPPLPETAPGKIAQQFLVAINSGDAKETEKFVERFIIEEPWQMMTAEKYRSMLRKLREQSGDLRVDRIFMANEREIRLMVESPKQQKKVGLEIVLPNKESTKAALVWIHHFPSKNPAPLPKESLDQRGQVAAVEKFLDDSAAAGIHSGAVLLAEGDTILLDRAWGFAHAGRKIPNETKMQYGTASVGKMFTGVAIGQLVQAGKLKYTDRIADHLPDYPNKEAAQKVQVRHLLAHTGGIADPFDSPKIANSKNYKWQKDWFETFAEKPLAFEPGARHEYSNGGFVVLAAIVEKISGMTFAEYLKKNVFEPANMRHTGLSTADERLPVSVPHAVTIVEDPLGLQGPLPKAMEKEAEDGPGMGGWTSTTRDLYNFARALRTNKLIDAAHTAEITSGKVQFMPPPMDVKYCYGFYEMPIGLERMVGHSGGGGDLGMGAELEMLWNSEYTIVVLSNQGLEEARRATHTIARFLVHQQEHGGVKTTAVR